MDARVDTTTTPGDIKTSCMFHYNSFNLGKNKDTTFLYFIRFFVCRLLSEWCLLVGLQVVFKTMLLSCALGQSESSMHAVVIKHANQDGVPAVDYFECIFFPCSNKIKSTSCFSLHCQKFFCSEIFFCDVSLLNLA